MTDTSQAKTSRHIPIKRLMLGQWIKTRFLSSPLCVVISLLCLCFLIWVIPPAIDWLWFNATFSATDGVTQCQTSEGACWLFIQSKYRLILFGLYPYEEQWRACLVCILLLLLVIISLWPRFRRYMLILWIVGLGLVALLMWGGVLGLSYVPNSLWGGLPITLILTVFGVAFSFPLGVLLALGRHSELPVIKGICVAYIEIIRGVPLISLLFMASVMLPLFLPEGIVFDKLLRAQIAIILFAAAYVAEAVRGGLQSVAKGQIEAAHSIGLRYWPCVFLIVLPQALKVAIPPLVGVFIGLFKDTSLVVIIGIYDLSLAAKVAISDPQWRGYSLEAYLFIAMIYLVLSYGISRYSRWLEQRLNTENEG